MTNKFSCFLTQKGRWLTATLFLLFSLGIGNAWGAGTKVELLPALTGTSLTKTTDASETDNGGVVTLRCCSIADYATEQQVALDGTTKIKRTVWTVNTAAIDDASAGFMEISVPSGYKITDLKLYASANSTSNSTLVLCYWTGAYSTTAGGYETITPPRYDQALSGCTLSASPIANTRTIRIYRQVYLCVDDLKLGKGTDNAHKVKVPSSGSTSRVFQIDVTYESTSGGSTPSATPSITTQPATTAVNYIKDAAATALSVEASASDGTLTYQWYKNTTNSNASGTAIDGATSASYTPSTAEVGTLYYYCAVTNTESGKSATTVKSNVSGAITTQLNPVGTGHTLTWNLVVRTSGSGESTLETATTDIGTSSKSSSSSYLTTLTDLTGVGVKRTTDGKSNNTGKIETPSDYDKDKYVTMNFTVTDGYQFTPSAVSIKTVAVSTAKDLKFEFSDANGSYSVTKQNLSTNGTAATNELDFSSCDKAFTGTVTIKIYVYGADNQYRLSTPLVITGDVAAYVPVVGHVIAKNATNGTIETSVGGAAVTSANASAKVDIVANPSTGYEFTSWDIYKTGETSTKVTPNAATASTYFTMPDYDVTVSATFSAIDYTITKNAATDGSFTVKIGEDEVTKANIGQTITLAATPATGYVLSAWTVMNGETPVEVTNNSFTMPAGNVTVSATFVEAPTPCYSFTAPTDQAVTFHKDDVITGSTGGSINVYSEAMNGDNSKNGIAFDSNGLKLAGGSDDRIRVTLNNLMQVGSVITVNLTSGTGTSNPRGLYLKNESNSNVKDANNQNVLFGWATTPETSTQATFTYTVRANDGLEGKNVFILQRSNTVWIRSMSVSECGAELHALTSAIDPVHDPAYATVTLSKSLIAAGGTAKATYSAIDAAYDFDEWVVSGATIDNAKANPVTITMGSADATITLKLKAAAVKHTVTYYDGEAILANKLGEEEITEGGNPTGAGLAPKKHGYTFGGWSTTNGGDAIASYASVTVDADKELFVVWTPVVCPTSGVVFSIVADPSKAPDSDYQIAGNTRADLATYATITRGAAVFGNADGNQRITINSSTSAITLSSSNARGYVKATMDCDLQEGDIIRITDNTNKFRVAFDSTATDKVDVSSGNHDVVIDAAHKDKYEFFIYRNGNDVTFSTIQVIRPYTVSFNMNGKTATAIDAQKVADGGKVTKPADPTTTNYTFEGWYKEAACTNAWDFTNDVVNTDVELFANWTAWPTMTLNRGAATSGDDVVTSVEPGSVVAVPACPFSYDGYNFNGWVYSQEVEITEGQFPMPATNLTLTAQWVDANNVAQIGSTKYATFAEAAAAVADGETIQLLQDCDYDATWTITGMAVTLDLNGKNLTGPASGDAVAITTDGVLTIMDGTATVDPSINGSNEITYAAGKFTGEWLINVYAGGSFVMNSGWLLAGEAAAWVTNSGIVTVNNGVLEALTNAVVMGPGNAGKGGYTMNIHGGILLGHMSASGIANGYSSMAVYHPNTGTLNIDGGTLISENGPGVVVRGGASNITGGTIIAQGNGGGKCGDANAPLIEEVGVAYDFKANYPGVSSVAATISGTASVSGTAGAVEAIYAGAEPTATEEAAVAISGGTFNTPVAEALCADDYYPATKPSGKYGVTVAALSVNFAEEAAKTEGQKVWTTFLTDNHYDYNLGDGGEISWDKANAYDTGLKLKKSTNNAIYFTTEPGKLIELTVGNIAGMTIQINGGAAQTITGGTNIDNLGVSSYYSDNAQAVVLKETSGSSGYNMLKSINIRDPYTVSFDANGGDAVASLKATPAITLPSATNGTQNFAGWYDALDNFIGNAGVSYTPTANIELVAHWEALSMVNTLSDLKVDGATVDGFASDVHTYYIVVPYGTAVADLPKITAATATNANATVNIYPSAGPEWTDDFGGCYRQQANVTPQDPNAAIGYNDIRITIAPKDPLCIIKAEHDGTSTGATITGYYGGTKDKVTYDDGKLGEANRYFGIKLAEEAGTFKAGDVLKIYATNPSAAVRIYSDKGTTRINATDGTFDSEKMFTYTLTEDEEWIYLYRRYKETETDMNPTLGYMAVYRPVPNPLVETITFNGAAGVVDNTVSPKTITVEVPASTDMATIPVVATFYSNDPSQTSGAVTGGTWAEGENEYIVTDKDGDKSIYTVTINKAAASTNVELATLTVDGNAITVVPGQDVYEYEYPYGTAETPAPVVAATAEDVNAEVGTITQAASKNGTATFTVTAEDGTTYRNYTVNFSVSRVPTYVIFDGSVEDDYHVSGTGVSTFAWEVVGGKTSSYKKEIDITLNGKHYVNSVNIFGSATNSSTRYVEITIPDGYLAKFYLAGATNNSGEVRSLYISKEKTGTLDESIAYSSASSYDGMAMKSDFQFPGTYYMCCDNSIRLYELSVQLYPIDEERAMTQGRFGTICYPNGGRLLGAMLLEIAYFDPDQKKIFFDEVIGGQMVAGAPYLFLPNEGVDKFAIVYTDNVNALAGHHNGLYGSYTQEALPTDGNHYIMLNNQYCKVVEANTYVGANRAYIQLDKIGNDYVAPAYGRRRVSLGVQQAEVATDLENLNVGDQPIKIMINGQMYILRGEKMYDATGRLVK